MNTAVSTAAGGDGREWAAVLYQFHNHGASETIDVEVGDRVVVTTPLPSLRASTACLPCVSTAFVARTAPLPSWLGQRFCLRG